MQGMTPNSVPCTQASALGAPSRPHCRTPLHQWHAARGARFVAVHGWQIAAAFTDVNQEIAAAQAGIAIADISASAKVRLIARIADLPGNSATGGGFPARPGSVVAGAWGRVGEPPDKGALPLVCRLTDRELLLLGSTPDTTPLDAYLSEWTRDSAAVRHDVTSALAGFHLIGPAARELLRRLTAFNLSESSLPPGSCAETSCMGVHTILLSDPSPARRALRLYVAWDMAEYCWRRLLDDGRAWNIVPIGSEAALRAGAAAATTRVPT